MATRNVKAAAIAKAKSAPVVGFTAVSFSRLNDWKKCPAYARFKHLDKLPEPGSIYLERGSAIHKLAENFTVAKKAGKLPIELAQFDAEFKALRKRRPVTEEQWAFDKNWEPSSWFDKSTFCRVVVDCWYHDLKRNVLVIIDHKTGKLNATHEEQLSLYALAGLMKNESVDGVEVMLWYLDHGIISPEEEKVYMRSEVKSLQEKWNALFRPMTIDKRFAPKPNNGCQYCAYSKAKKGPCEF